MEACVMIRFISMVVDGSQAQRIFCYRLKSYYSQATSG
jgi:hypothetical protein